MLSWFLALILTYTMTMNDIIDIGININDKSEKFTSQILSGEKTIETRNIKSLHPYIGKRVGIVRTGKGVATLVGYVTIGHPIFYKDAKEFDRDYKKHRVGPASKFYITKKGKWGYPILNPVSINPPKKIDKYIPILGRVSRKINL